MLADDVGGGFGLKNGVHARGRRRHRGVDRPRPPGQVDRGPARAPRRRRAGPRGDADIEAAVTADGVLLGVRMDAKLNLGAYACDPVPRRDLRRVPERLRSRARPGSRASPRSTPRCSPTRRPTSSYRGSVGDRRLPPRAPARHHRPRARSRSARRPPPQLRPRADEPPLAMLTGQPFVGVTTHEYVEQAARARRLATASGSARRQARGRGPVPRDRASPSYLEAAPGPPGCRPGRGATSSASESPTSRSRTTATSRRHPPAAARTGPRDDAGAGRGRRARRHVRRREGRARRHRRDAVQRSSAPAAAARRRWRTARCCTRRASSASRSCRSPRDVLEASADDLEIDDGVISVQGVARRRAPARELARDRGLGAGSDCRRAPTRELEVTRDFDGGQSGWSGGTHVLPWSRSTSRPGSSRSTRYVVVEDCGAADQPRDRRGSDPRRRRPGRSARSSTSTPPTTTTASSWRRRSWTTSCRRRPWCRTSRSSTSRRSLTDRTSTSAVSARAG